MNGEQYFFQKTDIVICTNDTQLVLDTIKSFTQSFHDSTVSLREPLKQCIEKIIKANGHSAEIIAILIPLLKDPKFEMRVDISWLLTEIVKINEETKLNQNLVIKALVPLLKDSEAKIRDLTLQHLTKIVKINDTPLMKEVMDNFILLLEDPDADVRYRASEKIIDSLTLSDNDQLVNHVINALFPFFQHSDGNVIINAYKIFFHINQQFLFNPDIFEKYLTHSYQYVKEATASRLQSLFEKYLNDFQAFDQLFQRPLSDLSADIIIEKLFKDGDNRQDLRDNLQNYLLDKGKEEQLKLFLVSEINKIKTLKGPGIIELALVGIGHERVSADDSKREKLVESAKEVLNIQLRYLSEEGLIWINKNCEKLLSLSGETKIFYKKVYHKLLEDEEITSLEEQLLIKFINQGLTTSLTRDGEIIFEGKRYKLRGENIELALEKIAKTVIDQQQDILAMQYKQHEPIFKISSLKCGMKQAASDIKEIRSIVDSRHSLQSEFWLLTRLKSLKFNSEILLLEQRSAFGDHVVYHWSHQKLIRFYPGEVPVLQEIFGSYIYGEAYQGEVFELTDLIGQKLLENPDMKPAGEGQPKSKQIYFQQELLKQGNEDRNSAVEEELAKKLDNNRAVLKSKLKSLNLKDTETNIIEDYYEAFVSTFSSVYTSSQAIDSGKLSIDDGEDFFSPVNLFIQLTSLAPFGIGNVLSSGLEAARSYIKSTTIANEAKFVKDFAIDAVELSDLVSKIALNLISNKEQRKNILEAKEDEEPNSVINKAKNLIFEKIEKLKSLAEKYTKMKNLFEKEVETSPAFRLGESDANKIIKEWIDLKGSQPDLRLKPEEKQKKFTNTILGEVGEGNKITPMPTSPQEIKPSAKDKTACCEIF